MNNTPTTVKDSGERELFQTGSVRDTRAGKGRYDLLPTRALRRLARHFEAGAVKYGDRNWEKGQPISRFMDSGLRHLFMYLEGWRDEDHLAAAAWNITAAIETEERVKQGLLPLKLKDTPTTMEYMEDTALNTPPEAPPENILSLPVKITPAERVELLERLNRARFEQAKSLTETATRPIYSDIHCYRNQGAD